MRGGSVTSQVDIVDMNPTIFRRPIDPSEIDKPLLVLLRRLKEKEHRA